MVNYDKNLKVRYLGDIHPMKYVIKDLRLRDVDPDNELSDDFLIEESYQQYEWSYI